MVSYLNLLNNYCIEYELVFHDSLPPLLACLAFRYATYSCYLIGCGLKGQI